MREPMRLSAGCCQAHSIYYTRCRDDIYSLNSEYSGLPRYRSLVLLFHLLRLGSLGKRIDRRQSICAAARRATRWSLPLLLLHHELLLLGRHCGLHGGLLLWLPLRLDVRLLVTPQVGLHRLPLTERHGVGGGRRGKAALGWQALLLPLNELLSDLFLALLLLLLALLGGQGLGPGRGWGRLRGLKTTETKI